MAASWKSGKDINGEMLDYTAKLQSGIECLTNLAQINVAESEGHLVTLFSNYIDQLSRALAQAVHEYTRTVKRETTRPSMPVANMMQDEEATAKPTLTTARDRHTLMALYKNLVKVAAESLQYVSKEAGKHASGHDDQTCRDLLVTKRFIDDALQSLVLVDKVGASEGQQTVQHNTEDDDGLLRASLTPESQGDHDDSP